MTAWVNPGDIGTFTTRMHLQTIRLVRQSEVGERAIVGSRVIPGGIGTFTTLLPCRPSAWPGSPRWVQLDLLLVVDLGGESCDPGCFRGI